MDGFQLMSRLRALAWRRTRQGLGRLRAVAVALALTSLAVASASAQDLAPDTFADLTFKILSYDQTLRSRVTGNIQIGVISAQSNAEQAQSLVSALTQRGGRKVSGFFVETRLIDLDAAEAAFSQGQLTCVVVFGDVGGRLGSLSDLTRRNGVLSLGSRKEHLPQLSVGLVEEGGRVKIYRSDAALRAERIQLDASFLNLARPL